MPAVRCTGAQETTPPWFAWALECRTDGSTMTRALHFMHACSYSAWIQAVPQHVGHMGAERDIWHTSNSKFTEAMQAIILATRPATEICNCPLTVNAAQGGKLHAPMRDIICVDPKPASKLPTLGPVCPNTAFSAAICNPPCHALNWFTLAAGTSTF